MASIVEVRPSVSVGEFIRKFGVNSDVDTAAAEDVIAAGGDQYWPTAAVAATSISINSSSANDTAAGSGARTLFIEGLDGDGNPQSETVTLNGVTAVNPANAYYRIQRAWVLAVGSGGVNEGNITIADGTGTLAYVPAAKGQTQQAAYTVPAGRRASLLKLRMHVTGTTAANAQGELQWRPDMASSWRTIETINGQNLSNTELDYVAMSEFCALADIRLRVVSVSANNTIVSGAFELYLRTCSS